ncbi:hypothetical protein ACFXP7_05085 [Microbacterium sp. P06]|uniref:hypothetical protein n=1 Tax=Microbacterium sp. P06 TaxID=3366949 RepID=UPI00374521EA
MSTPGVGFDARPLIEPVDPAAARAFSKALRAQGRAPSSNAAGVVIAVGAVIVAVFVFLSAGAGVIVSLLDGGAAAAGAAVVPGLIIVGIIGLTTFLVIFGNRRRNERWVKLDRFARANGMTFVPTIADPRLPGMIFNRGSSRESSDIVRGAQPRFVEFANYRYTTGSGKNRTTHVWGYVAVKLDVPLPHIILDAVGNNGLFGSNLPTIYDRDQRLSLEGDFDRYFSLFCPAGYERDALYLFTPDIMARFIDNAAQLDVEIVDNWLFLYAKRDVSTLDPATWGWMFTVVAALLDKLAQWARWRDDHLAVTTTAPVQDSVASGIPGAQPGPPPALTPPPPGVAVPGRRLKSGVPWVAIIIFGGFGLLWLFSVFGGWGFFLSLLSR